MRYSNLFSKTEKKVRKYEAKNATLLQQAGYIDQLMSGVYTMLPLGLRVMSNIEKVVREEMDKIAQEVLMSTLSPVENWEKTGRFESVDILFKAVGANVKSVEKNSSQYVVNASHEEIVTPMIKKFIKSYRDLPVAVYQIQTKFRNEARPKSGMLRLREFRMKDLYSFHASKEDLEDFYFNTALPAYKRVFERLGIIDRTVVALALGGDFTQNLSHEFQTKCDSGEDIIYYDKIEDKYYNSELKDSIDMSSFDSFNASEVGNIFLLDTKYPDKFNFYYTDKMGKKKPVYMGCYGIGVSRLIGVIAEIFSDENGLVWTDLTAPFNVHLLSLDGKEVYKKAEQVYNILLKDKIKVLWDDRTDATGGEKFKDADLIGIPIQIIIGTAEIESNYLTVKERRTNEKLDIKDQGISKYLKKRFNL